MSLFKKLKREIRKARAPKGTVFYSGRYVPIYTGEAGLPDNLSDLHMMSIYYTSYESQESLKNGVTREQARKQVVSKSYELAKSMPMEKRPEWVMNDYLELFGTVEELNAYQLKNFCEKIEGMYIPKGSVPTDERYVVNKGPVTSRYDKFYDYFQNHIPEIVSAVCRLVEREKKESPMLYPGYCMYKDLMRYAKDRNREKKFTSKVWAQSRKYIEAAYDYYDIFLLSKTTDKGKIARAEQNKATYIDPVTKEAGINIQLCSEEDLLSAWKNTAESLEVERKERQGRIQQQKAAADSGDVVAMTELGKNAYYGRNGIPKDTARAFMLFSKAEKAGSGEAAYYLGEFYEKGVGHIIKDEKLAREYYGKALHRDYVPAIARQAEREWEKNDRKNSIFHFKKIVTIGDEKEDVLYIKKAIAHLICQYARGDVDENTISLVSLAFDYMRLDAPLVKKSDGDILALMAEAQQNDLSAVEKLEYYYDEYSHGPRVLGTVPASKIYQKDPKRAWEMQQIVRVLRLMKLSLLLEKASDDPEKYFHELATAHIKLHNISKATRLVEAGIKSNMPSTLYVAYYYSKELGYEKSEAMQYLRRSASMGYKEAIYMLEQLEWQENRTREIHEMAMKERPQPKTRKDYEFELELVEREISTVLGLDGASVDELALTGKLDFAQASLLRHHKNKFLDSVSED